ncbi:hypothetical protein CJ030_MR0G006577 [Morella rubra]|uniref:Uncharacterized protein n=1 Tax=Morella rubra TaxID=262757 RepID=A0A6A1UNL6_9ROSI|nr:hypothetical protein CJ030_MR0G006577 [Morella rubra]
MGSESNSASSSSTSSPCGKRARDPEDEVYLDNLHSHKRYLSEIMASSLNGLTVGDPLPDNLMESPARSESVFFPRDEISFQYSPMSEDSDDSRFCEPPVNTCSSQPDSAPTSPVSPYRYQRPLSAGLRRAALLRSVMRTQPPGPSSYELASCSGQDSVPNIEAEERPCSYMKSMVDEREYEIEECSSMGTGEPDFDRETPNSINMNVKGGDCGE